MHGLVDAAHVDHLHPDSGIALATAERWRGADPRVLRRSGGLGPLATTGVPARPRHRGASGRGGRRRSGRSSAATASRPGATRPTSARQRRSRSSGPPSGSSPSRAGRTRSDRRSPGYEALLPDERARRGRPPCCRSSAASPRPTGRRSATTTRQRRRPRLPVAGGASAAGRSSARRAPTTSCGPRSGRWSSTCRRPPRSRTSIARLRELHAAYRDDYRAYYERHADAGQPADARRRPGDRARPGHRDVPLRGHQADGPRRRRVLRQRDQRHARRRGHLDATPRSPRPRSSGSSTGRSRRPSSRGCRSRSHSPARVAFVTGAGSGIGKAIAIRLAAEGACVVVADIDAASAPRSWPTSSAGRTSPSAIAVDVTDEAQVAEAFRSAVLAFGGVDLVVNNAGLSISKPLLETTAFATGTSSTTSWPAARSSSRARPPGS